MISAGLPTGRFMASQVDRRQLLGYFGIDRLAGNGQQQIAGMQPGLVGGRAGDDAADQDAVLALVALRAAAGTPCPSNSG